MNWSGKNSPARLDDEMKSFGNFLEMNTHLNTWVPPEIPEYDRAVALKDGIARQFDDFLYIFQIEPYIDSIYIEYGEDLSPVMIQRFAFHEDFAWDGESEAFFHEHCVKVCRCGYEGGKIDQIFQTFNSVHGFRFRSR